MLLPAKAVLSAGGLEQLNLARRQYQFKRQLLTSTTTWAFVAKLLNDSCELYLHEIGFYSDLKCETAALPKDKFSVNNCPAGNCADLIDGKVGTSEKMESTKDSPLRVEFILDDCADCVKCVMASARPGSGSPPACTSFSLEAKTQDGNWNPVRSWTYDLAVCGKFQRDGTVVSGVGNGDCSYSTKPTPNPQANGPIEPSTSPPTNPPRMAPLNPPTSLPSKAPSTPPINHRGDFEWDIVDKNEWTANFNNNTINEEITGTYVIPEKNYEVGDDYWKISIFQHDDCETYIPEITASATTTRSNIGETKQINLSVKLDVDLSTISLNKDVWFANNNSNDAEIKFCVRIDLHASTNNGGKIVNYHKTKLTILINMEQDMPSVRNISTSDGIVAPISTVVKTVDYKLEAFQCDANNNEISSPSALVQGSVLRVCVKSNVNDVYPVKINSLTLSKGNVVASPITANDASFLTETTCNSGVCYVATMMEAVFFEGASQDNVIADGTVRMAFGKNQATRRLGLGNSSTTRTLESDTTSPNQFNLEIKVERDNIGSYSGVRQSNGMSPYEKKVFAIVMILVGSVIS